MVQHTQAAGKDDVVSVPVAIFGAVLEGIDHVAGLEDKLREVRQ
jgi:hypothetical protein